MKIWTEKGVLVLELSDVQYDAKPRLCQQDTKSGRSLECGALKANGEVLQIRRAGRDTSLSFTCGDLLENIACGLMGRSYLGDCTVEQMKDSSDLCSEVLVNSDGTFEQDSRGRAYGNDAFGRMADTWKKAYLGNLLDLDYGYSVNFAKSRAATFKHHKSQAIHISERRSLHAIFDDQINSECLLSWSQSTAMPTSVPTTIRTTQPSR